MVERLQAIRGMNDILPAYTPYWSRLENTCRTLAHAYNYHEIRLPLVEKTALFNRTVGQDTDIVTKEMYSFKDRNNDDLSLRPEGTAGCVRACLQHGLIAQQTSQRLWYLGPMFRHERPQKGRTRQFSQFGVEAFGLPGPHIDVELIVMSARLLKNLGLAQQVTLHINSLGSPVCRAAHRKALVQYFKAHQEDLDEDSKKRLYTNPLRLLDSKQLAMRSLIEAAPTTLDYLNKNARDHFDALCCTLKNLGIDYKIDPRLVRGLDYYGLTVFEWMTDQLGAQGTVCAGGRYDGLVEKLGGKPTPAIGFAVGLERLALLLESHSDLKREPEVPDAYFIAVGEKAWQQALMTAEMLRDQLPNLSLRLHCGSGHFKHQFKQANKCGATWAIILGDDEMANQRISLKHLRNGSDQDSFSIKGLIDYFKKVLG